MGTRDNNRQRSTERLPAIMTKIFLKILEGFQNDEFSLNCPKCQNDEKSGGSIMTKKIIRHYGRSLNKYSRISRTKLFSDCSSCDFRVENCFSNQKIFDKSTRDNYSQ